MRDYYGLIGVPENASDAWIERAHRTSREALEKNVALKPAQRDKGLAELDAALATLTDPRQRATYDAKLELARAKQAAGGASVWVKRAMLGLLLLTVIVMGAVWLQQREAERVRVEQESRDADLKAQRLLAEIAAQRLISEQRSQREKEARQIEEDRRLEEARVQREKEVQTQKYVFDDTAQKEERARKADLAGKMQRYEELRREFGGGRASWTYKNESERLRLMAARNEFEQLRIEILQAQEAEFRRKSGR